MPCWVPGSSGIVDTYTKQARVLHTTIKQGPAVGVLSYCNPSTLLYISLRADYFVYSHRAIEPQAIVTYSSGSFIDSGNELSGLPECSQSRLFSTTGDAILPRPIREWIPRRHIHHIPRILARLLLRPGPHHGRHVVGLLQGPGPIQTPAITNWNLHVEYRSEQ